MEHLRRAHPSARVSAKVVYNEYIADKHHVHMNSTKWLTLTDFVKFLGREGYCKVDQTEKGWHLVYIKKDIEEELEEERKAKRQKAEKVRLPGFCNLVLHFLTPVYALTSYISPIAIDLQEAEAEPDASCWIAVHSAILDGQIHILMSGCDLECQTSWLVLHLYLFSEWLKDEACSEEERYTSCPTISAIASEHDPSPIRGSGQCLCRHYTCLQADGERQQQFLQAQIERAMQSADPDEGPAQATELLRDENGGAAVPLQMALGKSRLSNSSSLPPRAPMTSRSTFAQQDTDDRGDSHDESLMMWSWHVDGVKEARTCITAAILQELS